VFGNSATREMCSDWQIGQRIGTRQTVGSGSDDSFANARDSLVLRRRFMVAGQSTGGEAPCHDHQVLS